MMKKLIVIGGLFSFLAVVAIACQKRNKEKDQEQLEVFQRQLYTS